MVVFKISLIFSDQSTFEYDICNEDNFYVLKDKENNTVEKFTPDQKGMTFAKLKAYEIALKDIVKLSERTELRIEE